MDTVEELLGLFQPISLDEMNDVKLLNRLDMKYVFKRSMLCNVFENALSEYKILEINGNRSMPYETIYFDTPRYNLYLLHHNRKLNRHKVRIRTYKNTDTHFFEIKFKSNKGRTIKNRIPIDKPQSVIDGQLLDFLQLHTDMDAKLMRPALQVNFNRITLVNNRMTERVTVDIGLKYLLNGVWHEFPEIVIVEVKYDKINKSSFIPLMRRLRISPMRMSKYCFGIAGFVDTVKKNNFKTKILYVNKLCKKNA